ncbi:hypothetical protein VTN49DRAFT_5289 [Thermomyces lanuginosus]|uniref:uncharacterized protein n=1 Tax=Thermomyces lanuginosus TaxID=5541 RepID=UPI00374458F3
MMFSDHRIGLWCRPSGCSDMTRVAKRLPLKTRNVARPPFGPLLGHVHGSGSAIERIPQIFRSPFKRPMAAPG